MVPQDGWHHHRVTVKTVPGEPGRATQFDGPTKKDISQDFRRGLRRQVMVREGVTPGQKGPSVADSFKPPASIPYVEQHIQNWNIKHGGYDTWSHMDSDMVPRDGDDVAPEGQFIGLDGFAHPRPEHYDKDTASNLGPGFVPNIGDDLLTAGFYSSNPEHYDKDTFSHLNHGSLIPRTPY